MKKIQLTLLYLVYFLMELLKSNLRVAKAVLSRKLPATASLVKVPTDLKSDWALFIYANSITLTPGTISVEIADDKKSLWVHSMFIDTNKKDFVSSCRNGFERRLKEIFR